MSQHLQNCPTRVSMRAFIPRYPRRVGGDCWGTAVHNALLWPSVVVLCTLTSMCAHRCKSPWSLFDLATQFWVKWRRRRNRKMHHLTKVTQPWAALASVWTTMDPFLDFWASSSIIQLINPSKYAAVRLKHLIRSAQSVPFGHNMKIKCLF